VVVSREWLGAPELSGASMDYSGLIQMMSSFEMDLYVYELEGFENSGSNDNGGPSNISSLI
jgi:hypothetical protein